MPKAPPKKLAAPLIELHGIGPERAAQLARLGLHTVEDLLCHRPRQYEDRQKIQPIASLKLGETTSAHGAIVALGVKRYAHRTKSIFEFILDDGTGRLHCRWWNLPYMENYFHQGDQVLVHGRVLGLKPRTMDHPETEVMDPSESSSIHLHRLVPVYPLTEGLSQRWLRSLVWRTLDQFEGALIETEPQSTPPILPTRARAFHQLHFPGHEQEPEAARARLAFDEYVALQSALLSRRLRLLAAAQSRPCPGDNSLIRPFLARLGFKLTAAQTRVLREIRGDMSRGIPMRRLLQGDVGSGKTVVAACCALMVLESGFTVALMAPTEILAEQHFETFRNWLQPFGLPIHLHTASVKTLRDSEGPTSLPAEPTAKSSRLTAPINRPQTPPVAAPGLSAPTLAAASQKPMLVIGTHALIAEGFTLENLGLVIIDEQHKFGAAQREQLVRKGFFPHLLVMTATPIPRTLGLTLYGDLDLSVVDEKPEGRSAVKTFVRPQETMPKIRAFLREKLDQGRQAYIVYPRIDEAPDAKALLAESQSLEKEFAPHSVSCLHGRMPADDQQKIMRAFRDGAIRVLLATSVVEVGLDVANATVMIVENAEQFGLAQLHQLRGRIGRGSEQSFCILVSGAQNAEADRRLRILESTADGFQIAEADLKMRGPGDLLGWQQSGLPPLRFGDLSRDLELINQARRWAATLAAKWDAVQCVPAKSDAIPDR